MQDTWVQSLGQEDPLEKGMATHSSVLAWRIPWTEEPGGLQFMGLQSVVHDWATNWTDFPVNENIGTWSEVATEHRKPWTWLMTWTQPSAFSIPAVSDRNRTSAPCVILNFPIATLKNAQIGKLTWIFYLTRYIENIILVCHQYNQWSTNLNDVFYFLFSH